MEYPVNRKVAINSNYFDASWRGLSTSASQLRCLYDDNRRENKLLVWIVFKRFKWRNSPGQLFIYAQLSAGYWRFIQFRKCIVNLRAMPNEMILNGLTYFFVPQRPLIVFIIPIPISIGIIHNFVLCLLSIKTLMEN